MLFVLVFVALINSNPVVSLHQGGCITSLTATSIVGQTSPNASLTFYSVGSAHGVVHRILTNPGFVLYHDHT